MCKCMVGQLFLWGNPPSVQVHGGPALYVGDPPECPILKFSYHQNSFLSFLKCELPVFFLFFWEYTLSYRQAGRCMLISLFILRVSFFRLSGRMKPSFPSINHVLQYCERQRVLLTVKYQFPSVLSSRNLLRFLIY